MADTHLTLICEDVAAGAAFFRDILAVPVRNRDASHVDVELGAVTATLTARRDSPSNRPAEPAVILEVEVPDVHAALRELRRRGATVLLEPMLTEWNTVSAFVAGPDGVVVEVYCPHPRR
jgi:catechol 2,3-dioxygenase-like lactoylglutathione lyase family enzyme